MGSQLRENREEVRRSEISSVSFLLLMETEAYAHHVEHSPQVLQAPGMGWWGGV